MSPEVTQPAWAEQAPSLLLGGILVFSEGSVGLNIVFPAPLEGYPGAVSLCGHVVLPQVPGAALLPLPTQPLILINTQPLAACCMICIND